MLWRTMILSLALHLAPALRRARYPNESYYEYSEKMFDEETCFFMQQSVFQSYTQFLYDEQIVSVALLWNNTLEHAAAAMLRATLVAAGYDQDYIELFKQDTFFPSAEKKYALMVELPAKTNVMLQARLTPDSASFATICISLIDLIVNKAILNLPVILNDCGYLASETNQSVQYINIYIAHEWNNTCGAEKLRLAAALSPLFRILYLELSDLSDLIQNSDRPFFFLDSYKKYNQTNVLPVDLPNIPNNPEQSETVLNNINCTSTEVKKTVVLKYAVGNKIGDEVSERFVKFLPSLSDLSIVINTNNLISQNNDDENDDNMKKAACMWAISAMRGFSLEFKAWQQSAVLDEDKMRVAILICKAEAQDLKEYLYIMKVLADYYTYLTDSTFFNEDKQILLQTYFIDCANTDWFAMKLTKWYKNDVLKRRYTNKVIGVILPDEQADAAEPFASRFDLPLLTYDIYSGSSYETLHSATGSVEHLVLALRRLLAICGWQRLGIISELTRLAEVVSAALRVTVTGLTVRDRNIESNLDIPSVLQELLYADARVFLVNTGAATAAAVLAAAREFGLTPEKGFVWIVREYNAADHATAATRPISVSFWWRGERDNEMNNKSEKSDKSHDDSETNEKEITDITALRLKLEEKWQGRAWPLYAAPVLDALITLLEIEPGNYTFNSLRSYLWMGLEYNISGIKQNLTYNNYSLKSPLIFVEQWGTKPKPRLLATWRGGEWRNPNEACPADDSPSDGTTYCFLPSGDPFQPSCRELLWMALISTTIIGTILIIMAIRWSRKALLAHNLRIKTEYAKRMLARRERTFEALAEHLVDRKVLDLLQELGKGRFGRVYQGLLRESSSKGRTVVVAAKVLREDASSAEESEFLREACTLATLDHNHIIRFVGVCVVDGPPLLLMEHAFFGDLLQYLQARRCLVENTTNTETTKCFETDEKTHVSAKAITKLAHEAAMALAYLAQLGIVHRDVRASNCLVDERRCLKLADFGLARATGTVDGEYQMCRKGVLPVLWMAPESLAKGMFSPASDVWSFGVLVFELVTLGRRPYGVQPPPVVLRHVVTGGRPQLPWDASAETRALTRACWCREPKARPTAARIADWLNMPWRTLRPALVAELVDIDRLMNDNDFNEPDLCPPDTTPGEPLKTQSSNQSEYIVMTEIS